MHPICVILCEVYSELLARKEVLFPLEPPHITALDSTVKTVNARYFGLTRFTPRQRRAAAYFCYLIKNHPVTDGNKRLAVLWLTIYCTVYNLTLRPLTALDELAVSVEGADMPMDELVKTTEKALFSGEPEIIA